MKNIALAGNPNSGKSTLFNALTGGTAFVGNWPGVTVEKRAGKADFNGEKVNIMDLPGIYSLSPYSSEEIISRDYIIDEKPDAIINIVDASNLERNLYLTTQLLELGVPVIVALNMMDVVKAKGEKLSSKALSKQLGCPVCEISAIKKEGLTELKNVAAKLLAKPEREACGFRYSEDIKAAISTVKEAAEKAGVKFDKAAQEFYALKILSNDESVVNKITVPDEVLKAAKEQRDALEAKHDDDIESIIAEERYNWIRSCMDTVIVKRREKKLTTSDKIDKVLTNKILALPAFFAIIYVIYFICLNPSGLGKKLVGITFTWVINAMIWTATTLTNLGVSPWLVSLVSDGIVFGVGIVVAFIPYLMILFVFLAILEECGYMARVTFIMDRLFRRFGLSGKSFIPMLLGTGCTVQAMASSRTIENENDRKLTIFLTPFIPCATMMPTIILVVGLFTDSAWVAPLIYLISICFVILGGIFLKNTFLKSEPAPFVMELPEYKIPRLKNVWHFVWEKTVGIFRKLTSIIVVSTVVVWFLKYFSFSFEAGVDIQDSMLASIGKFLAPLFIPIGLGSWEIISSMITGYVAKDNMLATLGLIFGTEIVDASGPISNLLSGPSAISFLLFFILSCPCFASIGAMRKELGTAKLTWQAIAFQMGSAYLVALIAYQVLNLFM